MNDAELLRYSRQIMLPEIEIGGQDQLLSSKALVIGLGGLGCPVSIYLAASGVGQLVLMDDDRVDISNLQRQIAHTEKSIGMSKVDSAARAIKQLNSSIRLDCIPRRLDGDALKALIHSVDVVLDATDNFSSRHEINDACLCERTPLVSGAAIRLEGQIAVFDSRKTDSPCYRCLYHNASDVELSCAENGVVSPLVGIIGTIQAMEGIKLLAEFGEPLTGYVLYLDAKRMDWRKLKLNRDPNCPSCAQYL